MANYVPEIDLIVLGRCFKELLPDVLVPGSLCCLQCVGINLPSLSD